MAKKVGSFRLELDHDGIRQLLESAAIGNECEAAAHRIADIAGDGFEVSSAWHARFGGGRVAYSVRAETTEAKIAESEGKALTLAVHACSQ
jgi:hypothetical protein